MNPSNLKDLIEEKWLENLSSFIESSTMDKIMQDVVRYAQRKRVLPDYKETFNAFKYCPLEKVKTVILGQDPYPDPMYPNGLAFSSKTDLKTPSSLKNIFKEIENEYDTLILERGNDLTSWAEQGVLLLNTSLTVNKGEPGSHKGIWDPFIDEVFKVLNNKEYPLVFLLWGNHAKAYRDKIKSKHHILETTHPSPLSASKGFFGCDHFRKANYIAYKNEMETIDWTK